MFVVHTKNKGRVSDFLNNQFSMVTSEISKLTKYQIPAIESGLAGQLADKHTVIPLELDKFSTTLDEKNLSKANTTWQFKGNYKLLGLVDSTDKALDVPAQHSYITSETLRQVPIAGNQAELQAVKEEIALANKSITTHLQSINDEVAAYNRRLRVEISQLLAKRKAELNQIKAAEDFLNS
jgi:hypothetical protein